MNTVGFVFNPHLPKAAPLAAELAKSAKNKGWTAWIGSAWDEQGLRERIATLKAVVTLGGDGTILRAARIAAPAAVPLIGVNLGRLGFLTELTPDAAHDMLPRILEGESWVEARGMLSAKLIQPVLDLPEGLELADLAPSDRIETELLALNDLVLGRGERCRTVKLKVGINGATVTSYRADGIVLATATGSTAYSLSGGGPILHPEMQNILITPLLAHLKLAPPMVLPEKSQAFVQVSTDHSATLSIDGQVDIVLKNGSMVDVKLAEQKALFLRNQNPSYFYETLAKRLNWE